MATLSTFSSSSSFHLPRHRKPPPPPTPPSLLSTLNSSSTTQYLTINNQRKRSLSVVTRAGPSTSNYIFAFVLPLSLLAVTIFAASRVADKLDQKFLEELAVNQEILDADADEDDSNDGNAVVPREQEQVTPPRTRNRPKREVEPSSTS